ELGARVGLEPGDVLHVLARALIEVAVVVGELAVDLAGERGGGLVRGLDQLAAVGLHALDGALRDLGGRLALRVGALGVAAGLDAGRDGPGALDAGLGLGGRALGLGPAGLGDALLGLLGGDRRGLPP